MTKIVWVILANPENSSCVINAVYNDKEKAEQWIKKENEKLGNDFYWVERSQLIDEKENCPYCEGYNNFLKKEGGHNG